MLELSGLGSGRVLRRSKFVTRFRTPGPQQKWTVTPYPMSSAQHPRDVSWHSGGATPGRYEPVMDLSFLNMSSMKDARLKIPGQVGLAAKIFRCKPRTAAARSRSRCKSRRRIKESRTGPLILHACLSRLEDRLVPCLASPCKRGPTSGTETPLNQIPKLWCLSLCEHWKWALQVCLVQSSNINMQHHALRKASDFEHCPRPLRR